MAYIEYYGNGGLAVCIVNCCGGTAVSLGS